MSCNQAKLEDQRNHLVHLIESKRPQGSMRNKVTVVFDGQPGVYGGAQSGPVRVTFSKGDNADNLIRKLVDKAENKRSMIVVTNDRELQYAVRALGAKVEAVEDFLKKFAAQRGKSASKKASESPGKRISKTQETNITDEFSKIWLKKKQ